MNSSHVIAFLLGAITEVLGIIGFCWLDARRDALRRVELRRQWDAGEWKEQPHSDGIFERPNERKINP